VTLGLATVTTFESVGSELDTLAHAIGHAVSGDITGALQEMHDGSASLQRDWAEASAQIAKIWGQELPNEVQAGVDQVNAITKNANVVPDFSGGLSNALKQDAPKPLTGDDIAKQLYAISQSSDEASQKIAQLNQLYGQGLITAQAYDSAVEQALGAVTRLGQFNLDDVLGNSTESYADKVDALNNAWKRGIITFQQYKQNMKSVADENEQNMNTILSTTGSTLTALFKQSKGAAISNALINTYEGVTAALKLPFPLNWAQSALVAAAGFAQVANIRSQTQGGGGGSGASAASAAPAATAAQPVAAVAPTQTLEVMGLNPNSLFTGGAVRGLVQQLIDYQRDGGKVVLA
jgi:hypothetical protein